MGEVQAEHLRAEPLPAAQVGRVLQPLGRPRVHQRLLDSRGRRAALPGRGQGVPQLRARHVHGRGGSVPHLPLGQEPRALLPRPALVPLREGRFRGSMRHPRHRRSRPRAHRSTIDAERVRPVHPLAREPRLAAVQEHHQRSRPHDAGQASVRSLHQRRRQLPGPVEDRRQRDPIQQFYGLPYDRWEGYAFERIQLLNELQQRGVGNVVFITTDTHAAFANIIRPRTLANDVAPSNAPSGPRDTQYRDFIIGPVGTIRSGTRSTGSSVPPAPARHSPRRSSSQIHPTASECCAPRAEC